jgi:hypothetical protein
MTWPLPFSNSTMAIALADVVARHAAHRAATGRVQANVHRRTLVFVEA